MICNTFSLLRAACVAAAVLTLGTHAAAQTDDDTAKPPTRGMGGEAVAIEEFPWQVAMVHAASSDIYQGQFCGGTLISPRWVLSAAHCFADQDTLGQPGGECGIHDFDTGPNEVAVYSGSNDLEGGGILVDAIRIICHDNYDGQTNHNDIALIELANPIESPRYAQLAVPGEQHQEQPGRIAIVTGWGVYQIDQGPSDVGTMGSGATDSQAFFPTLLQGVRVPIVSDEECARGWQDRGLSITVDERHICAGLVNQGRDTCRGDSGGPLHVGDSAADYVQVGIVSWGARCESGGYYNIYTQVSNYVGWIDEIVAGRTPVVSESEHETSQSDDADGAAYGTVHLNAGFSPDPHTLEMLAGGSHSAADLDSSCRGYIASRSDYNLEFVSGENPLFISASSDADTTLVVMRPDGTWICSDDHTGHHPAVEISNPQSGTYRIWVGTYARASELPAARLGISEVQPAF